MAILIKNRDKNGKFVKGHSLGLRFGFGQSRGSNEKYKKISFAHIGKKLSQRTKRKISKTVKKKYKNKEKESGFVIARRKNNKFMIGKNNPNWIEDRNQLAKRQERNDMAYKEWRKKVWERDSFKCRINN